MTTRAERKAAARTRFEGVYHSIRGELLTHFALEGMPQEAVDWFAEVYTPHRSSRSMVLLTTNHSPSTITFLEESSIVD